MRKQAWRSQVTFPRACSSWVAKPGFKCTKSASRTEFHYQHTKRPPWRAKFVNLGHGVDHLDHTWWYVTSMKWLCGLCHRHRNDIRQRGTSVQVVRTAETQQLPSSPGLENIPRSLVGCHPGWSLQVKTSLASQPIKPTPPADTKWVPLRDPESYPESRVPRNDPLTTGKNSKCRESCQLLSMWFWEGLKWLCSLLAKAVGLLVNRRPGGEACWPDSQSPLHLQTWARSTAQDLAVHKGLKFHFNWLCILPMVLLGVTEYMGI